MRKIASLAAVAVLAACAHGDFVNGSFETGDFTGWTVTNASRGSSLFDYPGWAGLQPTDGTFLAVFGDVAQEDDTISQTLTTTPGVKYTLSFDLGSSGATEPMENFDVEWNGTTLYNGHAPASLDSSLTHFTYTVTGTGSDTASFGGYNFYSNTGLDNVKLTPQAVPEPASCLALAGGALALIRRRRAK